jgi:hypothetical protein
MFQPNLFEKEATDADLERVVMFALGEFQSRGKVLAGRSLPLDRLKGAVDRACHRFGVVELSDREIVEGLAKVGAEVVEIEGFAAKRPFRVTADERLAVEASDFFATASNGFTTI